MQALPKISVYAGEPVNLELQFLDAAGAAEPLAGRSIICIVSRNGVEIDRQTGTIATDNAGNYASFSFGSALSLGTTAQLGITYAFVEQLENGWDTIGEGFLVVAYAAAGQAGGAVDGSAFRFEITQVSGSYRVVVEQRGARGLSLSQELGTTPQALLAGIVAPVTEAIDDLDAHVVVKDAEIDAAIAETEVAAQFARPALDTLAGQIVTSVEINALASPVEVTARIQAAINANPGGIIQLPAMPLNLGVPIANLTGTDAGTALKLTAGAGTTLRGVRGVTKLKPVSNRVEMIAIDGATGTKLEALIFDNMTFGALQDQIKPDAMMKYGGVVGLGNNANCAVRQYSGAGLANADVEFRGFNTSIHYLGDFTNSAVTAGDLLLERVLFDAYCFGVLAHQPRNLYMEGITSSGCISSRNFGGGQDSDPGHALYLTNRGGAVPDVVRVVGVTGTNDGSSILKARKGRQVEFANVNVVGSGRGVEIWNVEQLMLSGINVTLGSTADTSQCGIELTDVGAFEVGRCIVDVRGASSAWAYRLRRGDSTQVAFSNARGRLSQCTAIVDNLNSTQRAGLIAENQVDLIIEKYRHIHVGTAASARYPIDLRACIRTQILDPIHIAPDGPSDAYRLASLDADCVGGTAIVRSSAVSSWQTNSVSDAGTATVIMVDGSLTADRRMMIPVAGSAASPAVGIAPLGSDAGASGLFRNGPGTVGVSSNGLARFIFGPTSTALTDVVPDAAIRPYLGSTDTPWPRVYTETVRFIPQAAAPTGTVPDGTYTYADGVSWNPGQGAGPYLRINGAYAQIAVNGSFTADRRLAIDVGGSASSPALGIAAQGTDAGPSGFYRTGPGTMGLVTNGVVRVTFGSTTTTSTTWTPVTDISINHGSAALRFANGYYKSLRPGSGTIIITSGIGSPEGSLSAPVGSQYTREDGVAGTLVYLKQTGTGNTGWVAKW